MNVISKLELETDSKQTIDLLLQHCTIHRPLDNFIANCRFLLTKFPKFKIRKIDMQQNLYADALTKEGRSRNLDLTIYGEPL